MKKLFAIIFSFQLILSPLAMSAEEDAYKTTGTGSKGGYDFYVNQVLTLATSSIGASILSQCLEGLKTPSIATFMGGSLVHIMSEIIEGQSKNQAHQRKLSEIKIKMEDLKTKGDSAQKLALETQRQEEDDNAKFIKKRKNWMIAVTAIYTAAMGLAIAEEVYGLASGSSTSAAACSGYASGCTVGAAACAAHCAAGIAYIIAQTKASFSLPEARTTLTAMCAAWSPSPGCSTWAQIYLNLVYGSCLMLPVDGGASMISWKTLLTLGYGFGTNQLGAGQGQVAQYGTMLISLLTLVVPSLSKMVVSMYNFPIPRSITFGAAAVFSGAVTSGLAYRQSKAEENVEKLDKVIKDFEVTTATTNYVETDTPPQTPPDATTTGPKPPKRGQIADNLRGLKKKLCFGKGSKGVDYSEGACANPMKISKFKMGNFGNFPALHKVAGLTNDLVNKLGQGDEAGAASITTEIGTMAAKVQKETNELKAIYADYEKKEKRTPVDIDKSVKDQVASLQANVGSIAKQNNISLADLAKGDSTLSEPEKAAQDIAVTAPQVSGIPAMPSTVPELSLTDSEETSGEETAALKSAPTSDSLGDFESTEQDINKAPDVSIFKQLSNRYILNYTKIFERKKAPQPAPEETKN